MTTTTATPTCTSEPAPSARVPADVRPWHDAGMASHIRTITFDARDPYAQALWWSEVLAVPLSPGDSPGDPEALLRTHHGEVLFVQVPEAKAVKNRAHLDLEPSDRSRDEEVARVMALGAVLVDDRRRSDGTGWVVLADPEGNEFCVLRSAGERVASG
jgi:predicted enzyme related to lactoylglutathione lyase